MSELVKVMRAPDYASEDFLFTLNKTSEISAKSYPTLFRTI
ncbi:MAG: hypothetical protein NT178_06220 [Proteobacteria bacterium]|nr:hypothetical protein [Pseudomonadota bacterium]